MRLDLGTLAGLVGGFTIVIGAIFLEGTPSAYINAPAILIVFGGSCFVVMIRFNFSQFVEAFRIAVKAFTTTVDTPDSLLSIVLELAQKARKSGLLSLEEVEIKNEFLRKGILHILAGMEAETVRVAMTKELMTSMEIHDIGQRVFKAIGDVAPAMGMIGTLVGLVHMMGSMNDPKAVGPAMAIALLTTLYGAVLANMVALPIAEKLALRGKEERRIRSLLIDAVIGIQAGQNPRILEELLKTYLPPEEQRLRTEATRKAEAARAEARRKR